MMAKSKGSLKAQIILQAVQLATDADISRLQQFICLHQATLTPELVLRILLTYLPEATKPETYTELLLHLKNNRLGEESPYSGPDLDLQRDKTSIESIPQQLRHLHLLALPDPNHPQDENIDIYTQFILHRAARIDIETGSISLVAQLVEPFVDESEYLQTWAISNILPLLRHNVDYYLEDGPQYSLGEFEKLQGASAIRTLLARAVRAPGQAVCTHTGRDLRGLIGPWMYGRTFHKRRRLDSEGQRSQSIAVQTTEEYSTKPEDDNHIGWDDVNEWVLDLASKDYKQAAEAFDQWDGPGDVDYGVWKMKCQRTEPPDIALKENWTKRYSQAGLSMIYATSSSDEEAIEDSQRILRKIFRLLDSLHPPHINPDNDFVSISLSPEYLESLFPSHLLHNALLRIDNPLTSPTQNSVALASGLLDSAQILGSHGHSRSCRNLLDLAVFENDTEQVIQLRKLLHTMQERIRDEQSWENARNQILWLRKWDKPSDRESAIKRSCGPFCKMSLEATESEILKALVANSCRWFLLAYNIHS